MVAARIERTGRKRGNNEGNIRQRADGLWESRVSLASGKRKSVYGKTRAEVQQKMTALLRDVQQGLPVPTGRQTVGQFMTRWLEDAAKPTVSPATYDSYRRMIERHIQPALKNLQLEKLTPQRIQQLQAAMLADGLSPRTVAYMRAILRRALGQAVKWNIIPRNPATLVDPPRQERHDPLFLTAVQAKTLMQGIAGDRLEPLILLTLVTGLRRGEVLSLRWRDLNLDEGIVKVEGQYQKWGGRWQWLPLKAQQSRRTLAIPAFVVQSLREHRLRGIPSPATVAGNVGSRRLKLPACRLKRTGICERRTRRVPTLRRVGDRRLCLPPPRELVVAERRALLARLRHGTRPRSLFLRTELVTSLRNLSTVHGWQHMITRYPVRSDERGGDHQPLDATQRWWAC